uniref:Uncharacterized protein n=1 Tax=Brassica oleracea var. oleracea TaxID=109376 RepID=A0A0D3EA82_BRAOL
MMYLALDKGHPTFTHFPTYKQHLWFRQFAAEENDGEPVDDLALMRRAYTNKKTGQIDDGLVRDVVDLVQTQVVDEVSQLQTEDDASTAFVGITLFRRHTDKTSPRK